FNGGGFFPGAVGFIAAIACQLVMARVLLADDPFAGYTRALAVVGGMLALYALWTLASSLWSHAEGRALIEFDRALLYLLVFILFGLGARRPSALRWIV